MARRFFATVHTDAGRSLAELARYGLAAAAGTRVRPLRELRDKVFAKSRVGREYVALGDLHGGELIEAIGADAGLRVRAARALAELERTLGTSTGGKGWLPKGLVSQLGALAAEVAGRHRASPALRKAAERFRRDLPAFADRSISEALAGLDPRPAPGSPLKASRVPTRPAKRAAAKQGSAKKVAAKKTGARQATTARSAATQPRAAWPGDR